LNAKFIKLIISSARNMLAIFSNAYYI
jgi:hypothetical protein